MDNKLGELYNNITDVNNSIGDEDSQMYNVVEDKEDSSELNIPLYDGSKDSTEAIANEDNQMYTDTDSVDSSIKGTDNIFEEQ